MPSGVTDGQAVDQAITNAAFLYKNANDTSSGVYTLNAATSGPQINDIQNTVNVLLSGVGGSQSAPATAYSGVPGSTISNGDTHLTALIKLAEKFFGAATAGGHTHSGTDGQGAPVIAVTSFAASGSSPVTGAVTISQGSYVDFVQTGNNFQINVIVPPLSAVLASGNSATAGINFSGGAIAGLSYCDWYEAGFPPGYPASGHVYLAASGDDHFYARTSASATRRVDATVAASGHAAAYGDVVIAASGAASISQSGQVITVYVPNTGAASANVSVFGSRSSPLSIGASSAIPFSSTTPLNYVFVVGAGAATASSIGAGAFVGQALSVISTNASSTVFLSATATNCNLNGTWVGDDSGCLDVVWDGTNWFETGRR